MTNVIIAALVALLVGIVIRDRLRGATGQTPPPDLGLAATESDSTRSGDPLFDEFGNPPEKIYSMSVTPDGPLSIRPLDEDE